MRRVLPWVLAGVVVLLVIGCGPLFHPLPPRLSDEQNKRIDDSWDAALTPVNKHDRQTWLDAMFESYGYQLGVDRLEFRSEKKWSGGLVVMEVKCDRAKPTEDRFVLTVLDHGGKLLRAETYTRAEVEQTNCELHDPDPEILLNPTPEQAAAKQAREKAAVQRLNRARSVVITPFTRGEVQIGGGPDR